MKAIPRPQEIYRHFKGNLYQIVTIAQHTETDEPMVVYQAMYGDFKVYVRPLAMFMSPVDRAKYPDVKQEMRFELQDSHKESHTSRQSTELPSTEPQNTEPQNIEPVKENMTDVVNEPILDPMLVQFLDADTYQERLNILAGLQHRITDDMIMTMAVACDIELEEGSLEEKYDSLKSCLLTLEKYECNRLR